MLLYCITACMCTFNILCFTVFACEKTQSHSWQQTEALQIFAHIKRHHKTYKGIAKWHRFGTDWFYDNIFLTSRQGSRYGFFFALPKTECEYSRSQFTGNLHFIAMILARLTTTWFMQRSGKAGIAHQIAFFAATQVTCLHSTLRTYDREMSLWMTVPRTAHTERHINFLPPGRLLKRQDKWRE